MKIFLRGRVVRIALVLMLLWTAQLACGGQSEDINDQSEAQSEVLQPKKNEELEDESEGSNHGDSGDTLDPQSESPIEPEFESDTLPCPPEGATLYLGFDHSLTINYEETSLTHFLHQGWLQLSVTDQNGTIASVGSPSIPYTMEGVMSEECTLESAGEMKPSAHGSCQAGVVNLIIEENWLALEGEMTCIDSDGDVMIMPFNVPPMGLQEHSGPNGDGEIFYLVEGSEGYSTMRPFLEGDGYHTWTLYTEDIPLEPLVP